MTGYAVDENVAIVANDASRQTPQARQANLACRQACIGALREVVERGVALLDVGGRALEKYRQYLEPSGQPGVGDYFYRHLIDNQFNDQRVRRIELSGNEEREFAEFPAAASLVTFDRSDRVFVALVLAAPMPSVLLNAVDSDYYEHREALGGAGVHVQELCADCLRTDR